MVGGAGADMLSGGPGDDRIRSGAGNDSLTDDVITELSDAPGDDELRGGTDRVTYYAVDGVGGLDPLDVLVGCERVTVAR